MIAPAQILVPIDFEPPSGVALRYGGELASAFGAALHVLHVVGDTITLGTVPPAYGTEVDTVLRDLEAEARARLHDHMTRADMPGVEIVEVVMTSTGPATGILSYAGEHDIELIVLGTHGRGAVAHLLRGSVSASVVRSAPCPVLTVRQSERDWQVIRGQKSANPAVLRHVKSARRRTVA